MIRIVRAAVQYWAVVFAFAFVVGVGRTLWLAPWVGETPAVLLELPLVLGASWFAARSLTRRHGITTRRHALAMGALAFAMLLLAEALLARALAGQTLGEWFAALWVVPGIYGLAGQVGFAVMPTYGPSCSARNSAKCGCVRSV